MTLQSRVRIAAGIVLALPLPLYENEFEFKTIGTSTSNIGALAFYQRLGFRTWRIERDFFSTHRAYPVGLEENGIRVRDMLWLDEATGDSRPI